MDVVAGGLAAAFRNLVVAMANGQQLHKASPDVLKSTVGAFVKLTRKVEGTSTYAEGAIRQTEGMAADLKGSWDVAHGQWLHVQTRYTELHDFVVSDLLEEVSDSVTVALPTEGGSRG